MNIKIQTGLPPIATNASCAGHSLYRTTLQGMKSGEWFEIPKTHRSRWNGAISKYMKRGQVGLRIHTGNNNKMIILRKAD